MFHKYAFSIVEIPAARELRQDDAHQQVAASRQCREHTHTEQRERESTAIARRSFVR